MDDSQNHTHNSPILVTAQFAYDPVEDDELALAEGDTVHVLTAHCTDPSGDWLFGLNLRSQAKGHFPSNYVTAPSTSTSSPLPSTSVAQPPPRLPPPPGPPAALPPAPPVASQAAAPPAPAPVTTADAEPVATQQQKQQPRPARVEYDYAAQKPGELNLTAGEKITVTDTDIGIHGWCRAENAQGEVGIFPENHIRFLASGTDADQDKQRKLAAYGVRIGMAGAVPMFPMGIPGGPGGLPALKKVQPGGSSSAAASPTTSNHALNASSSSSTATTADPSQQHHPALPRRPVPPAIPTGANTTTPGPTASPSASSSAALGHNRASSIPKLPTGMGMAMPAAAAAAAPQGSRSISPPSHPPPPQPIVASTDPSSSRSASTDLAATGTGRSNSSASATSVDQAASAALPTVSTDPVDAKSGQDAPPTSPPPALSSLTKARPAQAKRPPSNVRALAHTQASPITPTSNEVPEAPQPAVAAPTPTVAQSKPLTQLPPTLPAKPTCMPSSSSSSPEPAPVPAKPFTASPPPEPSRTPSNDAQQTATTPTTTARFGRVSSAIANLQANLGISGSSGSQPGGTASTPARPAPPLPGAKPLFGSLLRRQQSTGGSTDPAAAASPTSAGSPTTNGPPSPTRTASLPPLAAAPAVPTTASSPTSSIAATTGSTVRERSRSPSPTRSMTAPMPTSPTRASVNGAAGAAAAGDDDGSDVPSVQTLWDMVSALKIEVAGLRSLVHEERNARVAVEKRLAEVEEVVAKLTSSD